MEMLNKTNRQFFASLDWILQSHANRSTEPDFVASIVSMSLGFASVLDNVDTAVTELAAAGIHVSVGAFLRNPKSISAPSKQNRATGTN